MTLSASPAPPDARLTPEQFALLCAKTERRCSNSRRWPGAAMTPTGSETVRSQCAEIEMRLLLWADQAGGWKMFGSSSGFRLPDGSVYSPDASLVRLDRWQALTPEERRGFAPLCPDLVVELAIPGDESPRGVSALRRRMAT